MQFEKRLALPPRVSAIPGHMSQGLLNFPAQFLPQHLNHLELEQESLIGTKPRSLWMFANGSACCLHLSPMSQTRQCFQAHVKPLKQEEKERRPFLGPSYLKRLSLYTLIVFPQEYRDAELLLPCHLSEIL